MATSTVRGRPPLDGRLRPGMVEVDEDGILLVDGRRAIIPPIEARILNELGRRPERVVTRTELTLEIWGSDDRSDRALDSRIHTLRGRIAPLGLTIHTIRGHGFLLAAEPPPPTFASASGSATPRSNPWSNS